jgi:hypothetical protein
VITKDGIDLLRRMWPIYARGIASCFEPAVEEGGALRAALEGIAEAASGADAS